MTNLNNVFSSMLVWIGLSIALSASVNVYASPEPLPQYKITFVYNDGDTPNEEIFAEEDKLLLYCLPDDPIHSDWKFNGWYEDKELTTPVNLNDKVTEDMTIYAAWLRPFEFEIIISEKTYDGKPLSKEDYIKVKTSLYPGVPEPEFKVVVGRVEGEWPIDAGYYTISISLKPNMYYYKDGTLVNSFNILPAEPELTLEPLETTYDGKPKPIGPAIITPEIAKELQVTYWYYKVGEDSSSATETPPVEVGEYNVIAKTEATNNFNAAETHTTLTIRQAEEAPKKEVDIYFSLNLSDPILRDHIGLNPVEGRFTANEGEPFELRIWLDSKTYLSDIIVKVNGNPIPLARTEYPNGTKRPPVTRASGSEWQLIKVYKWIVEKGQQIEIFGVTWNEIPTSTTLPPLKERAKVYTLPGQIVVESSEAESVYIYRMDGRMLYAGSGLERNAGGDSYFSAPKGAYVVAVGGERFKVFVK